MSDLANLARRYYRAYEDDDRQAMEEMLAPDFTFTSNSVNTSNET